MNHNSGLIIRIDTCSYYSDRRDSVILYITWPALHGAETSEIPAPDHECMHIYTHRFSLRATSQQH